MADFPLNWLKRMRRDDPPDQPADYGNSTPADPAGRSWGYSPNNPVSGQSTPPAGRQRSLPASEVL
ncbi:MAG: hypothetical protein A07HR60_00015 [uncultured archaeon A07HR60]|nr:MAG: hypothetical protein A07HR60_00015 [uncultured archaeon A07HR60]